MLRLEDIIITQGDFRLRAGFDIATGRKTAVIGPSGSGKSTLLAAIGGFLELGGGRLWWNDSEITNARPGARPIAMLFQDNNLFPHLSIRKNIGLGIRPDLKVSHEDQTRIDKALQRVGLQDMGDRKPGQLSGGQQSRAALARVLVQGKPVILLDEPFAALGPALRQEMLDLVQDLSAETGATLLMVTHDPQDVRRIADDVIFVEGGRAAAPQPAAALLENPPPALRAYLG
ncbi:Thiamine import ATP-binding protein ThiQ [Roseobacter fucihabitans]|uniref:Thiamine import ATP-binding protein ThiQ n=1 Tax=Roseobacter fucihabitans TaxID=1537242 RepID=A0ABZ2BQH3_9RHOB|nr:ATP-binding cassette domain-containing protein [Roseobacter litoralis]MBC6964726.1 Thiamine import ATP-binding protein ThiQ [Roseobacter litoralis]